MATESRFAHFAAVGTWVDDGSRCDACDWHGSALVEPLLVQWEPSSEVIGDFSWDGPFGLLFVVTGPVAEFLRDNGFPCDLLTVDYVPPESRRKTRLVPYPYVGPKQYWAECRTLVDLDMNTSGVKIESSCEVCGMIRHTFRHRKITIRTRDWLGDMMFRVRTNEPSSATFVTEEGRRLIEDAGFSNVAFSIAGKIVE